MRNQVNPIVLYYNFSDCEVIPIWFAKGINFLRNCIIGPSTPIFFILSPGVNPLKDVEALGKKLGYTGAHKNFHNVSLGQGQEVVAEAAMATAAKGIDYILMKRIKTITMK